MKADDDDAGFVPLDFARLPEAEMRSRARDFLETMRTRRSVRAFSSDPVPLDVIRDCVAAAGRAPSGANQQPWTFVLVTDAETKRKIRAAAEAEERAFYGGRAPQEWLDDLAPLGTDAHKPFLEDAPALLVVFAQRVGDDDRKHYYVSESVGIAAGFLIAALHHAGLATLTHTPSPMGFLREVLGRPESERPVLLLPVGYPADGCEVPRITKKALDDILVEV